MNTELEKFMNSEKTENLFFYFKHDGAIDFQKKVIAGKILSERGFDKNKLVEEKEIIVDSIKDQIKIYENISLSTAKNKRKINREYFLSLGLTTIIIILGLKGYIMNEEPFNWIVISIFALLLLLLIFYKLMTYKTKLKHLMELDVNDKELLKFRLYFIEKEWDF